MRDNISQYRKLETRIKKGDLDALIVNDRTHLHPGNIDVLVEVTVELWHRVNAAVASLRQRRLITPTIEPVATAAELRAMMDWDGPSLLDFAEMEQR